MLVSLLAEKLGEKQDKAECSLSKSRCHLVFFFCFQISQVLPKKETSGRAEAREPKQESAIGATAKTHGCNEPKMAVCVWKTNNDWPVIRQNASQNYTCWISALARLLLRRRNRDDLRRRSAWSLLPPPALPLPPPGGLRPAPCDIRWWPRRAKRLLANSLLRPPVWILVWSSGVARSVTLSPSDRISCKT